VRKHPVTGVLHRSVLKPIGTTFTNKTVDFHRVKVSEILLNHLSGDDIDNTVVMGGEDWKMWMDALKAENLLAPGATTVAYSYIDLH
jgi:enoyl-[acyl-carrier protein] reductase/trans-2-enoyl-CoA reductase (NAD+)